MSDVLRWRYGDTNPVMLAVDSATVIEIGDLIYLNTDDARPASMLADGGSESVNQAGFHDFFVGVAMQRSRAGDIAPIRVATSGVFEFACLADTFEVGNLIGVDEAASGTQLEDQVVVKVAGTAQAIGRCAKRATTAATRVLVDIVSTVMKGGPMPA
ncbi:MAG: hypothetical protein IT427_13090 [Pirellulales bacterium]|nr:hypothetical protein [Pirellulales bacterium]